MKELVEFMREQDRKYEIERYLRSIYDSIEYFAKETGCNSPVEDLLDEVLEDFSENRELIYKVLMKESDDIALKLLMKFKDTLNEEIDNFLRLMDGI